MSSLRTSTRPPQEYSWLPGFLKKFDWPQAVVMFILIGIGLAFIYSIGNQAGGIAEIVEQFDAQMRVPLTGQTVQLV